jgi:hypothetical protein
MTTSKIKIKLGAIEIEYEGSETFLKEELPALLTAVSDLYQRSHENLPPVTTATGTPTITQIPSATVINSERPKIQATTQSIAAKLQVKSGPDLIMAAIARLTFVEGIATIPRDRITAEMKTANAYFKPTYVKNLSGYLHKLVKDSKLNESSKGQYALTARSLQEMESRIA